MQIWLIFELIFVYLDMRFLVFLLTLPFILVSGNRDSLANHHYKVKFSAQGNYTYSFFDFKSSYNHISEYRNYSENIYSDYSGHINAKYLFNPEFKVDFELPLWIKLTCGFNYNKLSFKNRADRLFYGEYYVYDSHSTQANPIVIGSNIKQEIIGYDDRSYEVNYAGTFLGLGLCKQFKRWNFDLDYSYTFNKLMDATIVTKEYDNFNTYQKTEWINFTPNNINQWGFFFLNKKISSSFSYRIIKKLSVKLGIQISFYDNLKMNTDDNSIEVNKMKSYAFMIGLVFNVL